MFLSMEHNEWLDAVTDSAMPREIAKLTGISYRTIENHKKTGRISAENVIKISEAYGVHPVTALIDTDYLAAKWATKVDTRFALDEATEEELADAVLRRMKLGTESGLFHEPVDQLAARRAEAPEGLVQDTRYAANRRTPEPEEGSDDYGPGA